MPSVGQWQGEPSVAAQAARRMRQRVRWRLSVGERPQEQEPPEPTAQSRLFFLRSSA